LFLHALPTSFGRDGHASKWLQQRVYATLMGQIALERSYLDVLFLQKKSHTAGIAPT
jgi:hypothetical protein